MLATIREFAREQLTEAEADEARAAHASFYLALANAAGPELRGGAQQQWLEMLARERDNLREALLWTASHGDRDRGFDAASQLWLFWWVGGALTEGLRICAELLDGEDEAPDSAARGQALFAAGMLAWAFGDPEAAEAKHRESLAVGQRLDDPSLQANALLGLAMAASGRGDYAASLGLHEASLALRADVDAPWETSVSLHNLGWTTHEQGDLVAARPRYEQALALRRDLHDHRGVMITLWCLGDLDQDDGDLGGARVRYREALEIARELNDRWTIRLLLGSLARLALAMQQPERALRLIGAVEALENSLGIGLLPQWRAALEHVRCAAETSVGPKAAETIAEGRSLPLPEAVAAGLAIAGS